MAVIPGIQICITQSRAESIIDGMVKLLLLRKSGKITRRTFLGRWRKIRTALFLTREYQELRLRIFKRSGGKCELCLAQPLAHVHHIVQVSYDPTKALDDENCKGVCYECHAEEH